MQEKQEILLDLLPHRSPMLLIDQLIDVSNKGSESQIKITEQSPFYISNLGVPAWVAVEYMGQTAALIAGYQMDRGEVEPHLGFLLGARKFFSDVAWFTDGQALRVKCTECAVVGNALANFDCSVYINNAGDPVVTAKLSVFRKPLKS